ncbi:MAG: C1 family peptidase [Lachnospiraceae bacterium]|nr:C1 family peptidase [Lachnospiraceae bacterium]
MDKAIKEKDLRQFGRVFDSSETAHVAMNAVVKNGINASALNSAAGAIYPRVFPIEVEAGEVCNQKKSGRCWMFASLNVMRIDVMKKLNLKNMELSQSYPFFYDKLERSNMFLETMLETLEEPLDGRLMAFLLQDPVGDGGQWDMFRSLIDKYGVVPQEIYPESQASSNSRELHDWLTRKLRGWACELRQRHEAGESVAALRASKEKMMEDVYRMLAITLGRPPMSFTWEARDKDGHFVQVADITPQDFFRKYVGWNLDDRITVINAPTADKPYHRTYTVKYLGNVEGGKYPVKYLNLPMEDLKALAVAQLRDGQTVWFGSDVDQFSDDKIGHLALDAMEVGRLFGVDFPMTKAQRLDYGESLMTHAMVITGVDLDEKGNPVRWKVENSWGKEVGKDGFYVMSDEWFSEYAYQILLDRKYLSEEQRAELDTKPKVLQPWDPMGSLAF